MSNIEKFKEEFLKELKQRRDLDRRLGTGHNDGFMISEFAIGSAHGMQKAESIFEMKWNLFMKEEEDEI